MPNEKKRVIISVNEIDKNNAGPKAKTDIDKILKKEGFQVINLRFNWHSKLLKFKYINWNIPRLMKNLQADEIFFQFPTYSRALMNAFIRDIRAYTKAKLILIIHDLESLRSYKDDPTYKPEEINWLKQVDGLIVHNNTMAKWIKDNGITTPMVILGLFDYLNPQSVNNNYQYTKTLCFAGNLKKAQFLSKVPAKISLDVYGPNFSGVTDNDVKYKGVYSPEELPAHLTENFGLIWDGSSAEECNGMYGEYLQYNCPHKASLYLSTGIPIIVWNKAAIASIISKNKLGYTISSLYELPGLLSSITQSDFSLVKKNALSFSNDLRNGNHIKKAIANIEAIIW
ncbi:sugar transferase [Limosilactobacillus reuteri]|uniref:Sugar transferase n=3 Tax=Limosilactobacillus reuteri TaxID=1598 RepID=A0A7L6BFF9_LIMRT|nr:sugar transferase [Limosilactobacillus reuteri]QLQ60883.1 sugar transferase [Limosilactobacillus reuteri]UFK64913.1 Glucosyltransferase 3 [Limosilactobacillus reuteri]HIS89072.1 sugar transferase [Candidatus Avigastranaerophilus faecigallinarum]